MSQQAASYKVILITGASSGIGQALALYFAPRSALLIITGRNEERLAQVAEQCRSLGAKVIDRVIDVTDEKAMASFVIEQDSAHAIDLVIANAGVSAGTGGVLIGEDIAQVRHVFDVNLMGVLNTIEPLRLRMAQRKSGHIAIMSSLAGYRGWPGAPAYCGSKAAVKVYGEALRGAMAPLGVRVSVICPGFVHSRMTAVNDFPMPFILTAEQSARIIGKGLKKIKGLLHFR